MAIILDGTTGVSAPAIVSLTTPLTAPNGGTSITSPGSSTNVLTSDGTTWYSGAAGGGGGGGITRATAQNVTGVGYVDFTGIPSTAKRISVLMYNCQATSGRIYINVGTSGGMISTGYNSATMICDASGNVYNDASTTALVVSADVVYGYNDYNGIFTLDNIDGYKWSFAGTGSTYTYFPIVCGGRVDATAAITTIRVALSTGNFTSGTVNIFYE